MPLFDDNNAPIQWCSAGVPPPGIPGIPPPGFPDFDRKYNLLFTICQGPFILLSEKNFLQSLILGFVSEFTVYFETVQIFS